MCIFNIKKIKAQRIIQGHSSMDSFVNYIYEKTKARISMQRYRRFESGAKNTTISPYELASIADALNCKVSEFFEDDHA
jgi:hypothetical protein